jgi:hypothetical protein
MLPLLVRMPVRGGRVLMSFLAMFVCGFSVNPGLVMLTLFVMMGRLIVMMSRSLMRGSGVVVMLLRRVLCRLGHV